MDPVFFGILLSVIAGLSTAIGSAVVFFVKKLKNSYLAFSLAFSTGVMLTVSFIELLPSGIRTHGHFWSIALFFFGAGFVFLIDYLIPHEYIMEKVSKEKSVDSRLLKAGLFTAVGLAIHNLPEGFAVFAGAMHSAELGIITAIAIAIHNIPEGIAVSIPIYFATKNKEKAFLISFLSGIVEPIGAVVGALVLLPFMSEELIGASLAIVAGIMVCICFAELLPAAVSYSNGNSRLMLAGLFLGSILMGVTLAVLV